MVNNLAGRVESGRFIHIAGFFRAGVSAMTLLKKMRKFNRMMQRTVREDVTFEEVETLLSEEIDANVYLLSKTGKILNYAHVVAFSPLDAYKDIYTTGTFPEDYTGRLLEIKDTLINLNSSDDRVLNMEKGQDIRKKFTTIIPLIANRDRLGTLLIFAYEGELGEEALILAEYTATINSIQILKGLQAELEDDVRKKQVVEQAINTLSYSELEAVEHIFKELDGEDGLLVASRIADKVGITRSVIVNALRKFESAGVIKSRSLGMKGTHIQVLNDKLLDGLKRRH